MRITTCYSDKIGKHHFVIVKANFLVYYIPLFSFLFFLIIAEVCDRLTLKIHRLATSFSILTRKQYS